MSRYTKRGQAAHRALRDGCNMAIAVDLVRRGYFTKDEAITAVRRFADSTQVDSILGEELNEHDRRNMHMLIDRIVDLPVELWHAEFKFWQLSVELDAPWVKWVDPMSVN